MPFPAETPPDPVVELGVPVTDQEPEPAGALAEVHEKVAGLPDGPGSGRIGGNAQDVHGPGLDLHDEQDMHTAEQHGIDRQEVAGQDAGRLAGCRQVGGARRGAGPRPATARIRRIVPSPTRCPRPISSPWMRLYPQRGFCRASCSASARTPAGTGGRPGAPG